MSRRLAGRATVRQRERSGSQDNIDNESESRQRVTGDLSPQCKQSEPVMDKEFEELGADERKKKRSRPEKPENEKATRKDKKLEDFWRQKEVRCKELSSDNLRSRNVKADGEAERGKLEQGSVSKRKNGLKGTLK